MRVAPTAVAAGAKDDALAVFDHLGDDGAVGLIDHDGAQGHAEEGRFTFAAMAVFALAVLAALGFPVGLIFVVDEIIGVVVAHEDDVSAASAIAAVGAAPGLVFFAAEGHAAAPAVAGFHFNHALVDEHRCRM